MGRYYSPAATVAAYGSLGAASMAAAAAVAAQHNAITAHAAQHNQVDDITFFFFFSRRVDKEGKKYMERARYSKNIKSGRV